MAKDYTKMKKVLKERRITKIRSKVFGTTAKPRLAVFRSLSHIHAQIIDDNSGKTLVFVDDRGLKGKKVEKALAVGKLIAGKAKEKKITEVVFDRRGNRYHGRVAALADGAREGGLKF
ncbi:MAG: 50S ribosomal protein L18 [Patescibacteria group bacterium]|jgi:large subunit ribosomal protein L18